MKRMTLPIRYSCYTAIALIMYFLILSIFSLHINPLFSLFNGIILSVGLYKTIQHVKKEEGVNYRYQDGFWAGMLMGFVATILFTVFFGIYATHISSDFLNKLLATWIEGYNTTVGLVLFVVAIMGFASTIVLTLSFMQLFKESWNIKTARSVSISEG
ncbi:DUF4199 domain-containing protein [Aquimarina rhabdastrellae]